MNTTLWLFDLDNTLHNADAGIFQLINQHMTHYLAQRLKLSLTEASHIRQDYWHRYGATLAGLQKHHPEISINDFLQHSHPIDEILAKLTPISGTVSMLKRLNARKVVFSNGPSFYVQSIIKALDIQDYFEKLYGTDDLNLLYKPDHNAYHTVCRLLAVNPKNCIMVDDSAENLLSAKTLGMTTIWFGAQTHNLPFIDFAALDMAALEKWIEQKIIPK